MGNLVYNIKPGDWHTVQDAISKIAKKLGPTSAPTVQSITISSTAIISNIACTSAKISTAAVDSAAIVNFTATTGIITTLSVLSATISSLAVNSLTGVSLSISIVTVLPAATVEGEFLYLNSSISDLFVCREK